MAKRTDFTYSPYSEPHKIRTKQILKEYPSVRNLIGKNPYTIFAILGLVAFQVVAAWLVSAQSPLEFGHSWWAVFGIAYFLGAFADHSLFVMIHECTHQLLFKKRALNRWASMIANMPQIFPSAISFEHFHLKHHSFQGVHELDADLPSKWEAKLIGNGFFGKAIWLLFFPLFQFFRLSRLKEIKSVDGWVITNFVLQVVFTTVIAYFFGWHAIAYLLLSFSFSVGLHPLGARWVQEHYLTHNEEQETYSYYGPLNTVSFNVGYHNEHHDFPSIPWNKLPKIKSAAPNYYDTLLSHNSWTKLWLKFLFDREISLFNRILRKDRGTISPTAPYNGMPQP